MAQAVAFSGGDDSTAMALKMADDGEDFVLLFTPAGDEPQELFDHIAHVVALTGKELVQPPNRPLRFWIEFHGALPNHRMRWCTRQIKIQPCIDWLTANPGTTLCVGLRADEDDRIGLYGDYAAYRYPLREWGWKDADVHDYNQRGHTFRSPSRDTWPASLAELRGRFERGDIPRGVELTPSLFDDTLKPCRVCTL